MNQELKQIQNKGKQKRKIQKALSIAKTKRVRHSVANRNVWFVQSGNPKKPYVWYSVQWNEFLQCFICECADFTYNCLPGDLCVHILACGMHESDKDKPEGGLS
jgi:hypothetical protein